MLSSISATLIGTFSCLPGGVNASLVLSLGSFQSPAFSAPPLPSSSTCLCPTCVAHVPMGGLPTDFKLGWPDYVYGGNNTLQIQVANHKTQDICLAAVNVTLNAVKVFPVIQSLSPNIASASIASTLSITADYLNPDQDYACFFLGDASPHPATVVNTTFATCQTISSSSKRDANERDSNYEKSIQSSVGDEINSNLEAQSSDGGRRRKSIDALVLAPVWASPSASYNNPVPFIFYPEPTITGITPNKAKVGDSVSVHGHGFVDSQYMSCRFDTVVVPATFGSDSSIECIVPAAIKNIKGGKVQVRVSLNGQDSSSTSATFQLSTTTGPSSKKLAIILGSIAGALLLIGVAIAVFVYRRKSKGKGGRDSARKRLLGNSAGYRNLPSLSLNSVSSDQDGIDMSEVKLLDKVGRGSFGDIYKAEWRGTEVAVKKIPFNSLNEDLVQEMLNEARIMESIRHPNVLSLMGCSPRPPEVCIIMEYMPRGSLFNILQDSRIPLSWQLIQRMALDAARGMNFLHQHNPIIMHRDLKSHNLLVDEAWRIKVADFGLSRMIEEHVSATMTVCGTPCWTAPEVLRNQRYSTKADVYSFGICLWEFYTRSSPYAGMTPFQVMYGVASSGMRPPINDDDCPEPWRELMVSCWSESPDDRPTFDQIAKTLQAMVLPETGGFH